MRTRSPAPEVRRIDALLWLLVVAQAVCAAVAFGLAVGIATDRWAVGAASGDMLLAVLIWRIYDDLRGSDDSEVT